MCMMATQTVWGEGGDAIMLQSCLNEGPGGAHHAVEGGVMIVLGALKHAANCLNIVLHDTWDIGLLEVEAEDAMEQHSVSDQCALNSDS